MEPFLGAFGQYTLSIGSLSDRRDGISALDEDDFEERISAARFSTRSLTLLYAPWLCEFGD